MKKRLSILIILLLPCMVALELEGQVYKSIEPMAHTFSVVARDRVSGEMAVGVQSHWFSVGSIVSWAKSGVGVIATQSFVNPEYGPDGLKLLEVGISAEEAVRLLTDKDEGRDFRQLAILDSKGNVSAYTGEKCIRSANHYVGKDYSVQANMMLNDKVIPAMSRAFEENGDIPLAERVLKVLEAAQSEGGDIRGKQSAVILVVGPDPADHPSRDKKIDLRVDDNENPIKELSRLLRVHRAYEHMNNGDIAIELGNMEEALKQYGSAEEMFPDNLEMKYWKAVALANSGRLDESLPIFRTVFLIDDNWRELTRRLPDSSLLTITSDELDLILNM